jgi:hypothetical protein
MRDAPEALKLAKTTAQKKAAMAFMLDVGLLYAGNSLLQDALDMMKRDKSLDEVGQGYVDRFDKLMKRTAENPLEILGDPLGSVQSLSSLSGHEKGKENRLLWDYDDKGTAIYLRNPTGKIGEEFIGWGTSPLEMLKRKESQFARPTHQMIDNDKGFGKRIYNPDEPGFKGMAKAVGSIALNYLGAQIPLLELESAWNIIKGEGEPVDFGKVIAPFFGITISKGVPGGPSAGEAFNINKEHANEVKDIMPEVRSLLKSKADGKRAEAIAKMKGAKMTDREIANTLRYAASPGRLSPRQMHDAMMHGTPEEKAKLQELIREQHGRNTAKEAPETFDFEDVAPKPKPEPRSELPSSVRLSDIGSY